MSEIEKIFVLKTSELEQFRNVQQVIALKTIYRVAARNPGASWDELIDMSRGDLAAAHERVRRGDKPIDEGMGLQEISPEEAEALQNADTVEEEVVFEELPPLPEPIPEPEPEPYVEPVEVDMPQDPDMNLLDDDEEEEEDLALIKQFSNTGGVLGSAADFDS